MLGVAAHDERVAQRIALPGVPVGHRPLEHHERGGAGGDEHDGEDEQAADHAGDSRPTSAATQASSSSSEPSLTYVTPARARLSASGSWLELPLVEAGAGTGPAKLVGRRHQDDQVVAALEVGLEQQRHLVHHQRVPALARGRRAADELVAHQRVQQPFQEAQAVGLGERRGAEARAVDLAVVGEHVGAEAGGHRLLHVGPAVELVHHGVRGQRRGAVPGERGQGLGLAGADPAGQTDQQRPARGRRRQRDGVESRIGRHRG